MYINIRNIKTNCLIKKGDNKIAGLYLIKKVYLRAYLIDLPPNIKIFPIFYNSLLRLYKRAIGLLGQQQINKAKSRYLQGRTLEREDGTDKVVEK